MPVEISTRSDLRKQRQRVELDGSLYLIDLTWRQRLSGWYLDIYAQDRSPLALGRRLDPGWSPTSGSLNPDLPSGAFLAVGPADYSRADLGESLRLIYIREAELAAFL